MSRELLAVSDANVLIDMEAGRLDEAMFGQKQMGYCVPDLLYERELKMRHGHLVSLGLRLVSLSGRAMEEVFRLSQTFQRVSRMDLFALVLAAQLSAILLTGDRELRKLARIYRVECHGTVWMVERLIEWGATTPRAARNGYLAMRRAGSRLPWPEVEQSLSSIEGSLLYAKSAV